MRKRCICLLLLLSLLLASASFCVASDSAVHWQDLRYVVFGSKTYSGGQAVKQRQILEQATSICIDQFGNSDTSMLANVKNKGVPKMPGSIDEINLDASTNNHREYTHRGWDFKYESDARNKDWPDRWEKRRVLLRNAVEYVFDFNGIPSFIDSIYTVPTDKCNEFCRLLYCIHIIGDHREYTLTSYNTHKEKILPLAGFNGQVTVISEIKRACRVLFDDQSWSELERALDTTESEIRSWYNITQRTEADMIRYRDYASKLLDLLSKKLSPLLFETPFFSKVFSRE